MFHPSSNSASGGIRSPRKSRSWVLSMRRFLKVIFVASGQIDSLHISSHMRGNSPSRPAQGKMRLSDPTSEVPGFGTNVQVGCPHPMERMPCRSQEVTPHKLQLCRDTLRWCSKKFGMLAVQERTPPLSEETDGGDQSDHLRTLAQMAGEPDYVYMQNGDPEGRGPPKGLILHL